MSQPGALTREHVIWAYRLLLDRDPENEDVIGPKLAGSRNTAELRHHLITSAEFRDKNPDFAHTNDSTIVIKEIAPGVRLLIDLSDHVIGLNILRGRYEQDEITPRPRTAETRRRRNRRRRAHWILHDADGGSRRPRRPRLRVRAARHQRRTCSSDRSRRTAFRTA